MGAKEKALKEYSESNYLIVYGHQHQIQQAFSNGWDAALKHLSALPVREALKFIYQSRKEEINENNL